MLPYAIKGTPLPLTLIHPRWLVPEPQYEAAKWNYWNFVRRRDAVSSANFESMAEESSSPESGNTGAISNTHGESRTITNINHRGHHRFVQSAYSMDDWLARQPAHIAAEKSREFAISLRNFNKNGLNLIIVPQYCPLRL